mgnify:CR=1 FL=1
MTKRIITTKDAPAPIGPYNQAVLVNETTLYTSGQIALDPNTMKLVLGNISIETNLGEINGFGISNELSQVIISLLQNSAEAFIEDQTDKTIESMEEDISKTFLKF